MQNGAPASEVNGYFTASHIFFCGHYFLVSTTSSPYLKSRIPPPTDVLHFLTSLYFLPSYSTSFSHSSALKRILQLNMEKQYHVLCTPTHTSAFTFLLYLLLHSAIPDGVVTHLAQPHHVMTNSKVVTNVKSLFLILFA